MPLFAGLVSSLLSGLSWLFRNRLGQWIVGAMAWMGISWATHEFAIEPWLNLLNAKVGQVSGQWGAVAFQWLGVMRLDECATMLASAVAAKYGLEAGKVFLKKVG